MRIRSGENIYREISEVLDMARRLFQCLCGMVGGIKTWGGGKEDNHGNAMWTFFCHDAPIAYCCFTNPNFQHLSIHWLIPFMITVKHNIFIYFN